jgi:hypothetical protein
MEYVAQWNHRAREDPTLPAVTLCTGRQQPYVEVLMQAIGTFVPGIFENGCGLYFPEEYRFAENPAITPAMRQALPEIRATMRRLVVERGLGYFQPGKELSLTLYPRPGIGVGQLYQLTSQALLPHADHYQAEESVACVNVIPQGVDKGAGVRWLAQELGLSLAQIGGIGDATSDLSFLQLVGFAAAPANATAAVRQAVAYVSPYEDGEGVIDVLHTLIRWDDRTKDE